MPNFPSQITERTYFWTTWKTVQASKNLVYQYDQDQYMYTIWGYDGPEVHVCSIYLGFVPTTVTSQYSQVQNDSDKLDFETNFIAGANQSIDGQMSAVQTQFERTDIDLKMARVKAMVSTTDGVSTAKATVQIPGTFGIDDGRYIAGGYGMTDVFDPDDFLTVWVEDTSRILCTALGLATDGTGDATIQGMGVLPGPLAAFGALPQYPIIKYYTDTDVPSANQGWYFYPLAQGGSLNPIGEIEVEPLGFYGHVPSGLWIVFELTRPNLPTGTLRGDLFWGESTTGR